MDLRNHHVHFKISDIYIPDPKKLLYQLHGNDVLEGRVVDMSDGGAEENAFAVIEVEGVEWLVVVPADRIVGVDG